jgi:ABC-type branched-subunit amino acid transport system ATPase component
MSSLLEVRGLSKRYGGVVAVQDVGFDVPVGKAVSLVGPNGAGKTTIFNLITGAVPRDSGSVHFNGNDITGFRPARVARAGISRTFQDLRVFERMTVIENVMTAFPDQIGERPWSPFLLGHRVLNQERELRDKATEILAEVGLDNCRDERAGGLSYAQQKLVVIARSIAMDAPLWLLDEPASGLDRRAVLNFGALLRALVSRGQTVLLVEHNLALVREVSDKVVFLSQGALTAEGTPENIFARPDLQSLYLGSVT